MSYLPLVPELAAEARPCAFCGGTLLELGDDSRESPLGLLTTPIAFWIRCGAWPCRARGPVAGSIKTALLDWNKRT